MLSVLNSFISVNINKSKIQFETYSQHGVYQVLFDIEWISINQRYNLKPIHNLIGSLCLTSQVNINKSKIQFETYSQPIIGNINDGSQWISINQRYNLKPIHNTSAAVFACLWVNINKSKIQFETYSQHH